MKRRRCAVVVESGETEISKTAIGAAVCCVLTLGIGVLFLSIGNDDHAQRKDFIDRCWARRGILQEGARRTCVSSDGDLLEAMDIQRPR
jgi:hypothetical protein